jgi:hypothetical protein
MCETWPSTIYAFELVLANFTVLVMCCVSTVPVYR